MNAMTMQVLEKCARMSAMGATLADCVASFPEQRTDIEDYFETAAHLTRVSSVLPSRQTSERGHRAMMNALAARERRRLSLPRRIIGQFSAFTVGAVLFGALTVGAAAAASSD